MHRYGASIEAINQPGHIIHTKPATVVLRNMLLTNELKTYAISYFHIMFDRYDTNVCAQHLVSFVRSNTLPLLKKLTIVNANRIKIEDYEQQSPVSIQSHK